MDRPRRNLIIFIAIFVVVTVVLCVIFWPFIRELRDPAYREEFGHRVRGLGWRGAGVLLGIQVLQVVVAVIPGGPVELLAGAAYGAWGGLALCLAGSVMASSLIFIMVRKFGEPLVEKFFRAARTGRFAFLRNTRQTSLAIFVLFLIPGTPKDTLVYLAPLSGIALGRFLVISTLARTPAILCTAILGDRAVRGDWALFLLIFLGVLLLGLAGIVFSDRILGRFKS